jgi:hypothetical protein
MEKGGLFRVRPLVLREAPLAVRAVLLGGHFFLFAFHAHLLQLALLYLERLPQRVVTSYSIISASTVTRVSA